MARHVRAISNFNSLLTIKSIARAGGRRRTPAGYVTLMRGVVELDYGEHGSVLCAYDKVGTQLIDAIEPAPIVMTFLHAENARELNLRKNDVFG